MKEYTVETHKAALRLLLEMEKPCRACPAAILPNIGDYIPCAVCLEFIGITDEDQKRKPHVRCPCRILGAEEAIRRTIEKLEEDENG